MTSRSCRIVALLILLTTSATVLRAQTVPRLEAGASAGGSAFGWEPHVGFGGEVMVPPLGIFRAALHGSMSRFDASSSMARSEMTGGLRLSTAPATAGWWFGVGVVRRTGLKDLTEGPRISTGGWSRIGPVVLGLSSSRRSAQLSTLSHFSRDLVTSYASLDSITGRWHTTSTTTRVLDSSRIAGARRWAETQGTIIWDARRWSAELLVGGRLAGRDVPAGFWAGAELAVRLSHPLSLVVGGGTASGTRFMLDAEHRYVTLGLRLRPWSSASAPVARAPEPYDELAAFGVAAIAPGRYRLSLSAPRAHSVELSGDFTGWKAVPLVRGEDGRWSVSLVIAPGTHRLNARVDGGAWIVPAGLTTMSDDFAGEVGMLVIEGGPAATPK